jgi:hypothetical protein
MAGSEGCANLKRVARSRCPASPGGRERANRMSIETPGRRSLQSALLQVRKREGGVRVEARTRHPAGCPGKAKAQGSIRPCSALTPLGGRGIPERVKARKPRTAGPARGFSEGTSGGGNGRRVQAGRERLEYLSGREGSEGRNPRSAAGMKQGRCGLGGRKPPRG